MDRRSRSIDLNADLGEGCPLDAELLARVTSASICCGAHAGDQETIRATLRVAKAREVVVGAHPGFADREGFGRREQSAATDDVKLLVLSQFQFLSLLAAELGLTLRFVKPHGALYNQAQREPEIAEGVIEAVERLGVPVLGQPAGLLESRAKVRGVRFIAEGFPDRRYLADGRLSPRGEPNAILTDPGEVEKQVLRLVEQGVATLCAHGDDPRAVEVADVVLATLRGRDVVVKSFL